MKSARVFSLPETAIKCCIWACLLLFIVTSASPAGDILRPRRWQMKVRQLVTRQRQRLRTEQQQGPPIRTAEDNSETNARVNHNKSTTLERVIGVWSTDLAESEWGPLYIQMEFRNDRSIAYSMITPDGDSATYTKYTFGIEGEKIVMYFENDQRMGTLWIEKNDLKVSTGSSPPLTLHRGAVKGFRVSHPRRRYLKTRRR